MSTDEPSDEARAFTRLDAQTKDLSDRVPQTIRDELRDYENVHGTGIGPAIVNGVRTMEPALIVYVTKKIDATGPDPDFIPVPEQVTLPDGSTIRTDVQETGSLASAQAGSPMRSLRIRPVIGGTRAVASHGRSGTLTQKFYTTDGAAVVILPYHVISESGESPTGADVYQHSASDPSANRIGSVTASSNFTTDGSMANDNDSCIISVSDDDSLGFTLGLGWITETGPARMGDHLTNSSIGEGAESGAFLARDVQISMEMPWGDILEYEGLQSYDLPGASGNSGAPVTKINTETHEITIVGIHVGSTTTTSLMIPWATIERRFGLLSPPEREGDTLTASELSQELLSDESQDTGQAVSDDEGTVSDTTDTGTGGRGGGS